MKKVLIIGGRGQLGTDLSVTLGDDTGYGVVSLGRSELDCGDGPSVDKVLSDSRPDIVINTAGFVRVDDCEDDPGEAMRVNALGAGYVAGACSKIGAVSVYISTDYVFGGDKSTPYLEEDKPSPLNVYGISKLSGEYFVRNRCPRHFIVRTSGLYGSGGRSRGSANFVDTMLRLAVEGKTIRVVNDQVLTPTFTKDLAVKIRELLLSDDYGTYHITNSGECSWYEFAGAVFRTAGLRPDLLPVTSEEYGARARRPSYSVLSNEALAGRGIKRLRHWEEALLEYISAGD